ARENEPGLGRDLARRTAELIDECRVRSVHRCAFADVDAAAEIAGDDVSLEVDGSIAAHEDAASALGGVADDLPVAHEDRSGLRIRRHARREMERAALDRDVPLESAAKKYEAAVARDRAARLGVIRGEDAVLDEDAALPADSERSAKLLRTIAFEAAFDDVRERVLEERR